MRTNYFKPIILGPVVNNRIHMLAERNLLLVLEIGEYTTETSNINYQSKAKEGVIVFWFRYRERGNKYT